MDTLNIHKAKTLLSRLVERAAKGEPFEAAEQGKVSRLELAIKAEHALPAFHKDPFDRMLVAQAAVERLTLLTADAALSLYADQAAIRVA